jgi:hypothetical protein
LRDTMIGWFIVLLMALFVWRFIVQIRAMNQHLPAEPDDEAYVHARLKPRPKLDSGAVALEEPDEDDEEQP